MSNRNRGARSFSGVRSRHRKAELRPTRLHLECLESRSMLSISPAGILPPGDVSQPPIGDFADSNMVVLSPLFGQIRSPTDSASSLDSGTNPSSDAELIHIQQTSTTINGVAGTLVSGVLATFTIDPSLAGQSRSATINWGDGVWSDDGSDKANVADLQQGIISGQHVYAQAGTYQISVTVYSYDPNVVYAFWNYPRATSTVGVANIAKSPDNAEPIQITGTSINGVAGSTVSGVLATFKIDPSHDGQVREAFINWGDWGVGFDDVRANDADVQQGIISGQHVYAQPGTYKITITVYTYDGPSLHEHDPGMAVPDILLQTAKSSVVSVVNIVPAPDGTIIFDPTGGNTIVPVFFENSPPLPIINGLRQPWDTVITPENSSKLVHVEGNTVTGVAGSLFSGAVGTFSFERSLFGGVEPTINWGDGTTSNESINQRATVEYLKDDIELTYLKGDIEFTRIVSGFKGIVSGQHVYAHPGTYQITVTVSVGTFGPGLIYFYRPPSLGDPGDWGYQPNYSTNVTAAVGIANIAAPPVDGGSDVAFSLTLPQAAATSQTGSAVIQTPLPTSATLDNSVTFDNAVVGPDALAFALQPDSASSPALVDPAGQQPLDTSDELTTSVDPAAVQLRLATL
jgi:hypothetical protein